MSNAMNWLAGGSWAPVSDAPQQAAAAAAQKQADLLQKQQDQLSSQKKAEQSAQNAKKVKSLQLLAGGSMLSNQQPSSILG